MHRPRLVAALLLASLLAFLPSGQATPQNFGSYGSFVEDDDGDFAATLESLPSTQIPYLAVLEAGSGGPEDDEYYIHFDDSTPALNKKVGDIKVGVSSPGGLLTSSTGSYDEIVDLSGDVTLDGDDRVDDFIFYLETDSTGDEPRPGFTKADWAYINLDTPSSGTLTVGDLRLSTPSGAVKPNEDSMSAPTGRYVKSNEADQDYLGDSFESDTFELRFFDADLGGTFETGDSLVAVPSSAVSDARLTIGQFFVGSSGSRTHGAHVGTSSVGMVPILEDIGATAWLVAADTDAGDCDAGDGLVVATIDECNLFIHYAATCTGGDLIAIDDVAVRRGATSASAANWLSRVTSTASTGVDDPIAGCVALQDAVFYINNPDDSTDTYTDDDFVYLDIPAALGGSAEADLSAGDVRLKGSTGNVGSTVLASSDDLDDYDTDTVNDGSDSPAWNVGLYDAGDVLDTGFADAPPSTAVVYLQWAPTGVTALLELLQPGDIKLASSLAFVKAADKEHIPTLVPFDDPVTTQYDLSGANPSSDGYYLRLTSDAGANLKTGDLRLDTFSLGTGGKTLTSSNTQERQAGAGSRVDCEASLTCAKDFADLIQYYDLTGDGITPDDSVYYDVPTEQDGQNEGSLGNFDIRLTASDVNGDTGNAGTMVRIGDGELSGSTDFEPWSGTEGYVLYFFDENRDGEYNVDDVPYLVHVGNTSAPDASATADLVTIRLLGGASSGSTGGGNNGNNGSSDSDSGSASASGSDSSTGSDTGSGSNSGSGSNTGSSTGTTATGLGAKNQALQASLAIEREDGSNTLSWTPQDGVDGYQVWSSNSPFVLLKTISDKSAAGYTDDAGGKDTKYLVTAFVGSGTLSAADVNAGNVPGYTGTPTGKEPGAASGGGGDKGFIPGFGLAVVAIALVGAAAVVRRKL